MRFIQQEEEFEAADKADLIRGLLQSGGGTQRCITLALDLATYNVIQDNDIWVSILEKIIKFQMLETAEQLLKVISENRALWVCHCFDFLFTVALNLENYLFVYF